MKIEVPDIDGIMDQIARIAPPGQKEDHKFLNLLRKAIEKNVVVRPSQMVRELAEKSEQRDLRMLSLALVRRDLPIEGREEFKEHIERVKGKIEGLKACVLQDVQRNHKGSIEEDEKTTEDTADAGEAIPGIREKLRRAQELMSDALSKPSRRHLEPSEYAENFFRLV